MKPNNYTRSDRSKSSVSENNTESNNNSRRNKYNSDNSRDNGHSYNRDKDNRRDVREGRDRRDGRNERDGREGREENFQTRAYDPKDKSRRFGKKFDKASKYSEIPSYLKAKKEDKKVFEEKKVRNNKFRKPSGSSDFVHDDTPKLIKRKNVNFSQDINKSKSKDSQKEGIRLNRYISNAGVCSRREADVLISAGSVSVNGKIITELGTRVFPNDVVKLGDEKINSEKKVYILLNKPKDYITTLDDPEGRKTVLDLVKGACTERIYPVGRLDRNTTGLLLLTNDGELTKKLTHPRYDKKKIYHVFLERPLTVEDFEQISNGFELEDGFIKPDKIDYVNTDGTELGIELHSGRNRIVRRIFEQLGYVVKKLDRVYYAGLTKKDLPRGKWRLLTKMEISKLYSGMYE